MCCKKAFGLLLFVGVVGVVGFVTLSDGPRAKVARDRVMQKIDRMLGESEVSKARIENDLRKLRRIKQDLTEQRIRTQVVAEAKLRKIKEVEVQHEAKRRLLVQLRDRLEGGEQKINVAGEEHTIADVRRAADQAVVEYEGISARLSAMNQAYEVLKETVDRLVQREKMVADKLTELENKFELIKIKLEDIASQKQAMRAMHRAHGRTHRHYDGQVVAIERNLEELGIKVETALRLRKEHWNEMTAKQSQPDTKQILADVAGPEATIDRINAALEAGK